MWHFPQPPATPAEQFSRLAPTAPPTPADPLLSWHLGCLRQSWSVSVSRPRPLPSTLWQAKGTSVRLHSHRSVGSKTRVFSNLGSQVSGIPSLWLLNFYCGVGAVGTHNRISDCQSIFPYLLFIGKLKPGEIQKPRFNFSLCILKMASFLGQ